MSFLYRHTHCPWCWQRLHVMRWFPRKWTSTICPQHDRAMRLISARRKAARMQRMEVC